MVQFSIPEYARILGLSKGPGPYSLKSTTLAELERLIRMVCVASLSLLPSFSLCLVYNEADGSFSRPWFQDYDFTQLTDDEKALLTVSLLFRCKEPYEIELQAHSLSSLPSPRPSSTLSTSLPSST